MSAAAAVVLAGLGFATLTAAGATGAHDALFDLIYSEGDLQTPAGEAASFALGVTGAVMVGWAAMMLVLLFDRRKTTWPTVWGALTVGLVAWFAVDTVVSASVGATGNLVLNAGFFAMFAPPLVATRPGRASIP